MFITPPFAVLGSCRPGGGAPHLPRLPVSASPPSGYGAAPLSPRAGSNLLVPPLSRRAGEDTPPPPTAPPPRIGGEPADKGGAAAAQSRPRPPPPAAGPGGAGGQRGAGALAQDGGGAAGERAPLLDAAAAAPAPGARRGLHGAGGPALSLLLRPRRPGRARWVRKEGRGGGCRCPPRAHGRPRSRVGPPRHLPSSRTPLGPGQQPALPGDALRGRDPLPRRFSPLP